MDNRKTSFAGVGVTGGFRKIQISERELGSPLKTIRKSNTTYIRMKYGYVGIEDLDGEIWVPIKRLDNMYEVSNFGRIKALGRWCKASYGSKRWQGEHLMAQNIGRNGYWMVTIKYNNILYGIYRHVEMARAFIPNPLNKSQVNHKDGVRHNAVLSNLEWVTPLENLRHSFDVLGRDGYKGRLYGADHPCSVPVIATNKKTGEKHAFVSINEAAIKLGTFRARIHKAISGGCADAKGFTFEKIKKDEV